MEARQTERTPADDQADEWHARLATRSISTETIDAFYAWRERPENAQAYRRVELLWTKANRLADDPDILAAVRDAQERMPKRRKRRAILRAAMVGAAACAFAAAGLFVWQGRGVYRTAIGQQEMIQLADGSTVRLDTDSRIRVRFSKGQRRIYLENGQALFDVAHDAARPFVVSTLDASVTAVGTLFEVRRTGAQTRVVLVEGEVDVDSTAGGASMRRRLAANQAAVVADGKTRQTVVDARADTSWAVGKLTFIDTPLSDAVAEVNRYLKSPIILDASAVADTPVNGVFNTGDRAAFVSGATHLLGLKASTDPEGRVHLIGPRSDAKSR